MRVVTKRTREIRFLREFAEFSCWQPAAASEALHAHLVVAFEAKDFSRVAHLLLALHAELVHAYELAGALLLAISQSKEKDSIIEMLRRYTPGEVPSFVAKLSKAEDWLAFIGFPSPEKVRETFGNEPDSASYNPKQIQQLLSAFVKMYSDEAVRGAYNKVKHGMVAVRGLNFLSDAPDAPKTLGGQQVYLILKDKVAAFPVSSKKSLQLAKRYRQNVHQIAQVTSTLACFAASCLDADLSLGRR